MVEVPKPFYDEMIAHALEDDSIECCGVLAGTNGVLEKLYRMTNVENSPYRFSWDSKELIKVWTEMEDRGWEHRAVYHSHTHSEAYPSSTDVRLAAWPEAYYLIVSLMDKQNPVVRAFRILDGNIAEEEIRLV
jgi:proteasome lid subunit RPN8/RPN11